MSTIALIADVHGNLPALEAVVANIVAHGLSRVVNLGDHVSDHATHGPSDRYAFGQLTGEHMGWLKALPARLVLDEHDMLLCHGTPGDDASTCSKRRSTGSCTCRMEQPS